MLLIKSNQVVDEKILVTDLIIVLVELNLIHCWVTYST